MVDLEQRQPLIDNDHIALDIESSVPDVEMESVLGIGHPHQQDSPDKRSARQKGMSLSSISPSMVLSWHSITARPRHEKSIIPFSDSIRSNFKDPDNFRQASQKHVLHNVYGVAHPGEVLALMGASGAGKTSLLNILTQRNLSTLKASGTIRLNGNEVDKHLLRKISAYVQQDDLFIGTMTVLEHLRFMALLRMGNYYSERERERRVQSVMADLGLKHCMNTIIGWPHRLKGLSGGERKRLAFASEIMTGPPILFCDEPTSGLDSYLAQQVIQVLKDLAQRKNMTIVVTIHQPSSQVFEMFDRICLLADGKLAFLGKIDEAISFFNQQGYPLPDNFNPADHFISILAIEAGKVRKSKARISKLCETFSKSDMGRRVLEEAQGGSAVSSMQESTSTNSSALSLSSSADVPQSDDRPVRNYYGRGAARGAHYGQKALQRYKASWFQQFGALAKRSFFVTLREPMLLKVRLVQTLLIGLLLGAIYFQTPVRQSTVMNINGLIFQAVANMNFMFQFAAVYVFCDELPIFMREHLANLYRVDAYFLAKNVAELAQYLLYPIIFSTIVYWMSGFVRAFDAYLLFTLSCVAVTNVAVSIAYAFACIFGAVDVATAVMPIVVIPLLAFGGFYINQESLPVYFSWLRYLSYFGYGYETAAINQWTRIGDIDNSTCENDNSTCYRDGPHVLETLSFHEERMIPDFLIMLGMIFVLRSIAFFALWLRAVTKK